MSVNRHTSEKIDEVAVMGILNVTPDSFSDGGEYTEVEEALKRALVMEKEGVDWLDIGGESSRPGASSVSLEEELQRTIPVIRLLKKNDIKAKLSIDTVKTEVMRQAIEHGIDMVNDISALADAKSVELLASHPHIQVCIMHMQGTPKNMQNDPHYDDVLEEVMSFFRQRIESLSTQKINADRIYLDLGFGFGKTLAHNITLFKNLSLFKNFAKNKGCAGLLAGVSRKRFIGELSGVKGARKRLIGSVSAALLSAQNGVDIIRVHDVGETVQALRVSQALI